MNFILESENLINKLNNFKWIVSRFRRHGKMDHFV